MGRCLTSKELKQEEQKLVTLRRRREDAEGRGGRRMWPRSSRSGQVFLFPDVEERLKLIHMENGSEKGSSVRTVRSSAVSMR
jgi:hypothetical protein